MVVVIPVKMCRYTGITMSMFKRVVIRTKYISYCRRRVVSNWLPQFAPTIITESRLRFQEGNEAGMIPVWKINSDQTYPRYHHLSASWGPIEGCLKSPLHHMNIVLRGLRRHLNWAHIMPRDAGSQTANVRFCSLKVIMQTGFFHGV